MLIQENDKVFFHTWCMSVKRAYSTCQQTVVKTIFSSAVFNLAFLMFKTTATFAIMEWAIDQWISLCVCDTSSLMRVEYNSGTTNSTASVAHVLLVGRCCSGMDSLFSMISLLNLCCNLCLFKVNNTFFTVMCHIPRANYVVWQPKLLHQIKCCHCQHRATLGRLWSLIMTKSVRYGYKTDIDNYLHGKYLIDP